MPGIVRNLRPFGGFATAGGGNVSPTQWSVFVNEMNVVRDGDSVLSHWPCYILVLSHCWATAVARHETGVFVEGIEVIVKGDLATCFHRIKPGSPNVIAGVPMVWDPDQRKLVPGQK